VILALVGLASQDATSAQTLTQIRQSADNGDASAQFSLGSKYYTGEGVQQDFAEAVAWFRKAADQGDATAQHSLGTSCRKGQGVLCGVSHMWTT
jgi:hypothetical protein